MLSNWLAYKPALAVRIMAEPLPTNMLLPYEILRRITTICLGDIYRKPTSFLLADPTFRDIGQYVLHRDLRFRSRQQMRDIINVSKLTWAPRALSIELAGCASDFTIFKLLHSLIRHIMDIASDKHSEGETPFSVYSSVLIRIHLTQTLNISITR